MKKRILSVILILCMVLPFVPTMAFAAEGTSEVPSVEYYAEKAQLMNDTFAPKSNGRANNIGYLRFGKGIDGKSSQIWYILGKDSGVSGDNTILFAKSSMADYQVFEDDKEKNKKFNSSFGVYESNPAEVFPNHYGASDLRVALKNMAADTNYFTKAEQGMMNATTVTNFDTKNEVNYTTTDKLYVPAANDVSQIALTDNVLIGSNSNIRLAFDTYWNSVNMIWLRTACKGESIWVYQTRPEDNACQGQVINPNEVQPLANLNLSSVLFASGVKAASSPTATSGSPDYNMTLRLDGSSKNIGTATYSAASGCIEITKGSTTGNIALVVQGKNGTEDWYYSKQIKGREAVKVSDIKSALGLTDNIDLSACKIWLETTDVNGMIYAVKAVKGVATEKELLSAVDSSNEKILLVNDITLTSVLKLTKKNITLDFNGYTLTGDIKLSPTGLLSQTNLILIDSNPTATHTDKTLPLGGVLDGGITLTKGVGNNSILFANGGTVTGAVNMTSTLTEIQCTSSTPTAFRGTVDGTGEIHGGIFYGNINESCIKEKVVAFVNGNSLYAREVVEMGKKAAAPVEPVNDGYVLLGWYKGDTKYDFTQPVTVSMALAAKWISEEVSTENGLKEALDLGSTFVKLTDDIKLSSLIDLSDKKLTIDLNGYVLTVDIKLDDTSAAPESILTLIDSSPTAIHRDKTLPLGGLLNGGITLTRKTDGTASHLYANGGTVTGMVSLNSYVSKIFCTSDTPTAFMGYVGNYGEIHGGIFYGSINESCIKGTTKTVTFMIDDSRYALEAVEEGNNAVQPLDPKKDGYELWDWRNGERRYFFDQAVTENITLTAHLSYCGAGSELRIRNHLDLKLNSIKLLYDIQLSKPLDLSGRHITIDLNGFVLSGADILINTGRGESSLTLIDSNPTATHTDSTLPLGGVLTSKISINQDGDSVNDFILYGNGGTVTSEFTTNTNSVAVKCTSATPTAFTGNISGYAHLHDGIYYGTIASTVTVHEKKATFKIGDKDYAYEIVSSKNETVAPIVPDLAKYGYQTLSGWYNGNTKYTFGSLLNSDITLTSRFSNPITYNIDCNLGGGKATNPTGYTVESNAVTLNNPTKIGYTFTGWSGTGLSGNNNMTVTIPKGSIGNRTYTAHYIEKGGYSVKFDTNGGSNISGKTNLKWTDKVLEGITATTKDGWNFTGWKCGEVTVTDDTRYCDLVANDTTASITLVAQWKDITVPVISGIENGKTYCSEQTVKVADNDVIVSVTVNGEEVTPDENNQFILKPAEGTQAIVVTDKSGNVSAEMIVTVNNGHTDKNTDHKCDFCGEILSECKDKNPVDHKCDICGATLTECKDENPIDHKCDICGATLSQCKDENPADHRCDTCGETLSQCKDENPADHRCDTCGETLSECKDENPADHRCDTCGETLSECKDENPIDHKCDTCGETLSECKDENPIDHKCDICGATLTKCKDENPLDNKCDICGATLSDCEHKSTTGHKCDVCGATLSQCKDEKPIDHKCDICGATLSECKDENPADHRCDICGATLSECKDENPADHKCDICGATLSECKDENPADHKCDICGETLSQCKDENPIDHKCDICGETLSQCKDENPADHKCDICGETLSQCKDENPADHKCDICGETLSQCKDENPIDHKCDICGATLTKCKDENPLDNICDICGITLSDCEHESTTGHKCDICGATLTECKDENPKDHKCDICGATLTECKDENPVDHKCDICGETLSECKDENPIDHKCDICGETLSECKDENPIDHKCDICGETLSKHSGGTATCTNKATCDICGEPYGELDSTNHNLENIPPKKATVTQEGNIEYWHCVDCGKYFSDKDGKNTIELKDTVIAKLPPEKSDKKEQSVSNVTNTITKTNTDNGDVKGSKFAPLKFTATSSKKKTVTLTWSKVKGAKGYIVYGAMCGKTMKKIKTTTGKSYTVKNLKSGKYYKYMVVAYKKVEGKKVTTAISKVTHVAVKGGKYGNPTKITVNKIKPIKQGKKYTIGATVTINKKVKTHVANRYESTDTKIATVNSKGVITAKAKGVCNVYVYAQNGVYKKVKVTVK